MVSHAHRPTMAVNGSDCVGSVVGTVSGPNGQRVDEFGGRIDGGGVDELSWDHCGMVQ